MVTYTYGIVTQTPAQKRVAKDDGSWEIRYRWDADNIAQETDDLGAVVADYTLQPEAQGDLISQYREMESSFYHYDGRTNTARLTDSAEVVTNEYVLDAWGGIVSESSFGSAADNEFLFMGQKQVQRDGAFGTKNPNYWARARQYDSKAGRFRSEDPIRDDESNLYRYAGNDPVNKVDPSGLFASSRLAHIEDTESPCNRRKFELIAESVAEGLGNVKLKWDIETSFFFGAFSNATAGSLIVGNLRWFDPKSIDLNFPMANIVESNSSATERIVVPIQMFSDDLISTNGVTSWGFNPWTNGNGKAANVGKLNDWYRDVNGSEPYKKPSVWWAAASAAGQSISESADLPCVAMNSFSPGFCQTFRDLYNKCKVLFNSFPGLQDTLATIYFNAPTIFSVFMQGAFTAFEELRQPSKLLEIARDGILHWMDVSKSTIENAFQLINDIWGLFTEKGKDASTVLASSIGAFLDFFNLNPSGIVSAIQQASSVPNSVIMTAFGFFNAILDGATGSESGGGVGGAFTAGKSYLTEVFGGIASDLEEKAKSFWESLKFENIINILVNELPGLVANFVAQKIAAFMTGGVTEAINGAHGLLKAISAICEKGATFICGLSKGIEAAVTNAAGASGTVHSTIMTMVTDGFSTAIDVIATLLGLSTVKAKVVKIRGSVLDLIKAGVKAAATKIMGLTGLFKGKNDEPVSPVITTTAKSAAGTPTNVSIYVNKSGKAILEWNPKCTVEDYNSSVEDGQKININNYLPSFGKLAKLSISNNQPPSKDEQATFKEAVKGLRKIADEIRDTELPCNCGGKGVSAGHSCFIADTQIHLSNDTTQAIDRIQIGQRVVTHPEEETESDGSQPTDRWKLLRLALNSESEDSSEIELLRSLDWIEDYGAHVGGSVFLNMPEMGVEGLAEVLAIEPCPPLEEGEGRLVNGTFKHTSGEVYDLKLASESKPIGVTGTHPFWSVDREAWVSAIDLEIGETLKTLEGTTVVESRSKREEPETVYNIEVEGDHVYRVGESGVLVHNASAPKECADLSPGQDKILSSWDINVLHREDENSHLGDSYSYRVVEKKVAVLKVADGQQPERWMQQLVQYGRLANPNSAATGVPAIPGVSLGVKGDDVGHIVGTQFGGYANRTAGHGNVFPQNRTVNRGAFATFEKDVVKPKVQSACKVCVRYTFYFDKTSRTPHRPTKFKYEWWVDGKQETTKEFDNPIRRLI